MADELARLRGLFDRREPEKREKPPTSAVLAPLAARPDGLHLLFTRRTETLSHHAGEISFPGGRIEASDASPLAAALREAREETGVQEAEVDVLGHVVDFLTFRRQVVAAYAGLLADSALQRPIARNAEVDEAFLIPVRTLLAPGPAGGASKAPPGATSPIRVVQAEKFESRHFEGLPETERTIYYWRLSNGNTLWGITAQIVSFFLTKGFGWKPPGPPKRITDAEDVLP